MKFETFLETISKSNNRLLVSNAKHSGEWGNLKHNKECLELFLNHNLSEVFFTAEDGKERRIIASSNTTLIKMFSLKKGPSYTKEIASLTKKASSGIHTKSPFSVLSWDFINNRYCTIPTRGMWYLGNWITISEDNISLLNETIRDILENTKNKPRKTRKKT